MITQKGKLIIISSPSGGGKNSVINALMRRYKKSTRLITTTTRAMRPGEEHGVDYHFISRELFLEKKAQENFLEYNEYAGNFYGTDKLLLEELLRTYDIVFSQIEVNGRANIQKAGIVHLAIFLMPESLDVLRERIVKRGGLDEHIIDERMDIAKKEMEQSATYDYSVVNAEGKFKETVDKVDAYVRGYMDDTAISEE